jgi:hypothetical protein
MSMPLFFVSSKKMASLSLSILFLFISRNARLHPSSLSSGSLRAPRDLLSLYLYSCCVISPCLYKKTPNPFLSLSLNKAK